MNITDNLTDLFNRISGTKKEQVSPKDAPRHWIKCPSCKALMFYKEVENQNNVCPKCNFHMRISSKKRVSLLSDSFVELDNSLSSIDPISFVDKKSYKKRLEEQKEKTGKTSSVVSGEATIGELSFQLVVFDFSYMGGSLGSVEGEKIVRAINRSLEKNEPLVIVSASGGARMQESSFSLMQMAKTSAALKKLDKARIPYISILTDPTMGGVSASFAMLGDIIIAEPGALIGFAGQRVIKQTIGADLPNGFQRAEFLLDHGLIDMIVDRNDLKSRVAKLLELLKRD
jgi:acetyl-CoA carboxylase carboxyl transferase subunit beta